MLDSIAPWLMRYARQSARMRPVSLKGNSSRAVRRRSRCHDPKRCSWHCARFSRSWLTSCCNGAALCTPFGRDRPMKSRSKAREGKPGDVRGAPDDAASAASISAHLISILDTVDLPIVALGHDFTVTRFNRAATALLGLTPSDVGRSSRDIRLLADVKGFEGRCARVIADESPCRLEVRDGARRFLLRIAPYTRSDGRIGGVVLTFTNVTAFSASIEQAIYE